MKSDLGAINMCQYLDMNN